MKICRQCGVEIINGENGCAMAGDICFTCKPWNMRKIAPSRRIEITGDYEAAILERQEAEDF